MQILPYGGDVMENDLFTQVGEYIEAFNHSTSQSLPCGPIWQSPGLETHIKKHHPNIAASVGLIPQIIAEPDFIGHNPKEPSSIELVKVYTKNLMVCVKLDQEKNYLYVASMYDITEGKLQNRIKSGRLKSFK